MPAHEMVAATKEVQDKNPWYFDIWNFLKSSTYPQRANTKEKRGIRHMAAQFIICGDKLYRRGYLGMHKLCVEEKEAKCIMEAINGEECGAYMNGII